MKLAAFAAFAAVVAVAVAPVAFAGSVPWPPPSGSADTFDYSGGHSDAGLFGSPDVDGDMLNFLPSSFAADTDPSGPYADAATDTLRFDATAGEGLMFTAIRFALRGDWSLLGDASLLAGATLTATDLDGGGQVTVPLSAEFDAGGSGLIELEGVAELPAEAGRWARVAIELEGGLLAEGSGNGLGFGQFKTAGVSAETAKVPLPPAVLAAVPAGLLAWRARRRHARGR